MEQEDEVVDWLRFGVRAQTFKAALDAVDAVCDGRAPLIVETGTTRVDGAYSDGQSTVLFDAFAKRRGGRVVSIDVSADNCCVARSLTSPGTTDVVCCGSVELLSRLAHDVVRRIDLLYLDSYDVDWSNPHPSALHHAFELAAVFSNLKRGCVVLVDDNANGVGKGAYVAEFMKAAGWALLADSYQIAFINAYG